MAYQIIVAAFDTAAHAQAAVDALKAGGFHADDISVFDKARVGLREPGLWQADYDHGGFYWIDCTDQDSSILSFVRQLPDGNRQVAVVLNLTPVPRYKYRMGLPKPGKWREVLNSDAGIYGGSNVGNLGGVIAGESAWHNQSYSAELTLPPIGVVALQPE